MPNTMTQFGFVKKSGDVMTGDLDIGLNTLIMNDTVTGGGIRGSATTAHKVEVLNKAGSPTGLLACGAGSFGDNILVASGKTVDGVDVSEIGKPAGGLYLGSDQENIPTGTLVTVQLDTIFANFGDEIEDTGNYKITPGVAGFYLIKGQVNWKSVIADAPYMARIRLNGTTTIAESTVQPAASYEATVCVGTIIYLSNTDYVTLRAFHQAGVGTVDIEAGVDNTFLTLERLR